ncbi:hypothetical protein [Chitinivorax sp. B]|uniref:hypothetical protein n=1 Tax=Chitinivorax sp. B TaxID=2502235 RepID=UPI001484F5C9|nr:hypothetical protein [Chitinivorax sp. B]
MFCKQIPHRVSALMAMSLLLIGTPVAAHRAPVATEISQDGIVFNAGFVLPSQALFAMQPGESFAVNFPLLGKKIIVHESHTNLINGVAFWRGYLAGDVRARVTLRFDGQVFVGSIRYNAIDYTVESVGDKLAMRPGKPAQFEQKQGDVVGYLTDKRGRPIAVRPGMYQVNMALNTLLNAQENDVIQLPLPNGRKLPLVFTGREVGHEGAVDWYGYSRDDGRAYQATLTMGPDATFGVITTPETIYRLETESGRTYLVDVKANRLPIR